MRLQMNVANWITVVRIVGIPIYLIFLYIGGGQPWSNVVATIVFALIAITDFLDGYIARKYNMITDLGKILDPIADKILVTAAMIALIDLDRLAFWLVVLMLARDFAMEALRNVASSKGIIIAAGIWGKVKTTFQMVAIGMLTYHNNWFDGTSFTINWHIVGTVLMYVSLVLSIYSAYIYFKDYIKNNEDEVKTFLENADIKIINTSESKNNETANEANNEVTVEENSSSSNNAENQESINSDNTNNSNKD